MPPVTSKGGTVHAGHESLNRPFTTSLRKLRFPSFSRSEFRDIVSSFNSPPNNQQKYIYSPTNLCSQIKLCRYINFFLVHFSFNFGVCIFWCLIFGAGSLLPGKRTFISTGKLGIAYLPAAGCDEKHQLLTKPPSQGNTLITIYFWGQLVIPLM